MGKRKMWNKKEGFFGMSEYIFLRLLMRDEGIVFAKCKRIPACRIWEVISGAHFEN